MEVLNSIAETAATQPVQVIEVVDAIDYTEQLTAIINHLLSLGDGINLIAGFLLFFVVVVLCYFVYKFFRVFF